jgi:hypothetical protein
MNRLFLLSAALLIGGATALAQATPGVTKRQVNQQARIQEGVRSGELTGREAARLQARQAKIQHDKRRAKADGVVTPAERARLHAEQNRASRAIHRQKHDAQKR